MDVKVLGSGSSGNAYIVSNNETALMIECGLTLKTLQELTGYRLTDIDACLVSHEHGDHAKASQNLAKLGIDVYMTNGTKEAINANERRFKAFKRISPYEYKSEVIGTFKVTPFRAIHDAKEPVGFRIKDTVTGETLTFLTDSAYCPYKFQGSNIFMLEINYIKELIDSNTLDESINLSRRNRTVESHMSLDTAIDFLKSSGADKADKIYIMHLSDANSNEEIIRKTVEEAFKNADVIMC